MGMGENYLYFMVIVVTIEKIMSMHQKNVFGDRLQPCSTNPMTGWYRDGYCSTDRNDHGLHTVCATMTREFLEYTKSQGNDLSTRSQHFPGLKPGDSWCLCSARWDEARRAGFAPRVKLDATNEVSLRAGIQLQTLQEHAIQGGNMQVEHDAISNGSCNTEDDICER